MYGCEYIPKLDIKEDYMFKKVFGDRDDNPILISFLNAVLNNNPLITNVKMLNSELIRDIPDAKTVILDIQAKTNDGTYIDVELQRSYASDLLNRMLLYGAKQFCTHATKGRKSLDTEPKVISIWILDCLVKGLEEFNDEIPEGNLTYLGKKDVNRRVITPNFRIIPIELPKLKNYKKITPELMSWLNFFKRSEVVSVPMEMEKIHEAYEKMKSIGGDKVYLDYLEAREKYEIDAQAKKRDAENKLKEEAIAKGKVEGERNAKIETAKNLLNMGLSIEQISSATGLTVTEIENI